MAIDVISLAAGLKWCLIIATTMLIGKYILILARKDKSSRLLDTICGPKAIPILGNVWDLRVPIEDILQVFYNLVEPFKKSAIVRLWMGPIKYIIVHKASAAEELLASSVHLTKSSDYDSLHAWLGQGLLTSTGNKWRNRRKLLTPSFHFKILEEFMAIFNEQSTVFVENLREHLEQGPFDIYPKVTLLTLDVICESVMGKPVYAQQNKKSEYVSAVYGLGELSVKRFVQPWLAVPWIFNFTSLGRDEKRYLKIVHTFSNNVIKERRQMLSTQEDSNIIKKKRLAFLDLLIKSTYEDGSHLTEEEIREEVDTFMFEGHDTTASAITFTIYTLGRHPEIQQQVHDEIDSIFEGSDRQITMQDLSHLTYLEAVIKETLRLYPSVPTFGRLLKEEAIIGGHRIPANTQVMVFSYGLHRDEDVFPDPEIFDPSRFFKENQVGRNPFAYIPFSAGFRNCIGQKFALMEEKVVLANFFRNYKVVSRDDPKEMKLIIGPILRPIHGTFVSLEKRN